jgi:hypothetical protein
VTDDPFRVRPHLGIAVAVLIGISAGLFGAVLIWDYVAGGVLDWGGQRVALSRVAP